MAKTYEDFIDLTPEEIKELPRRRQRLPAMALYVTDNTLSLRDISDMCNIPFGTVKNWADKYAWSDVREQVKEKAIEKVKDKLSYDFAVGLYEAASNHLERLTDSSNNELIPIITMGDVKQNAEVLEKILNMMTKVKLLDEPTQNVDMKIDNPMSNMTEEELRQLASLPAKGETDDDN